MTEQLAHASYLLSEQDQATYSGADYAFVVSPFTDILNLALFASVFAFIAALIFAGHKLPAIRDRVRYFRGRARTYQEFIPWILRFSLGIAFIGAGSAQVLISPAITNQPSFATAQIILGFLLIAGMALTPTTLAALALAVGALILHPGLIDNLEVIAALVAFFMLGQAKPGVDDLLGLPMHSFSENVKRWIPLVLRLGLGSSLVLMAFTDKLMNPHVFGAIVEKFNLTTYLPLSTAMWVVSATIVELILGLALLFGIQTRIMSAITFLILSLSFFFFGEEVYAHVTIFGTLFVLVVTGGGTLSIDHAYAQRRQRATAKTA